MAAPKNNTESPIAYATVATKKKDVATKRLCTRLTFSHWRHQSSSQTNGWQYISLIGLLVYHIVKVSEAYYRNVMLLQPKTAATVPARRMSDLMRVIHLPTGQLPRRTRLLDN